jgi:hypothetical protein
MGLWRRLGLTLPLMHRLASNHPRKPHMDPKRPLHRSKSLEDVVLKFIEKNNRVIWAVLFAIALAVIYGMNAT